MLDYDSTWLFDMFAGVYAWFTAQSAWRASCALMAEYLPTSARGRLLVVDLGCGPGVSTFEMARQRPDLLYIGLDRSNHMLEEARRRQVRAGNSGPRSIRWVRADAAALPFAAATIDVLTGHSFLYLLGKNNRSPALREMVRVLRSDGRVVLMEPHAGPFSLRQVLQRNAGVRHLIAIALWRPFSRLHVRYTPGSLGSILQDFGMVSTQTHEVLGGLGIIACARKAA